MMFDHRYNRTRMAKQLNGLVWTEKQLPRQVFQNVYHLKVAFMEGDADGYTYLDYYFKHEDIEEALQFINFLLRCQVTYPHGRGGYDTYEHVEGYDKYVDPYFEYDEEGDLVGDDNIKFFIEYWPCCCDGDIQFSMDDITLVYYNSIGVPHEVEVTYGESVEVPQRRR